MGLLNQQCVRTVVTAPCIREALVGLGSCVSHGSQLCTGISDVVEKYGRTARVLLSFDGGRYVVSDSCIALMFRFVLSRCRPLEVLCWFCHSIAMLIRPRTGQYQTRAFRGLLDQATLKIQTFVRCDG